jgi:N-acetylmuramoyl-L-alanine amidase
VRFDTAPPWPPSDGAAYLGTECTGHGLTLGICPGHGGPDRGISFAGIEEAAWTLAFGRLLASAAERLWRDLDVRLLRDGDVCVSPESAGEMGYISGSDFVLLLHLRGHTDAFQHGVTATALPEDERARRVGNVILGSYPTRLAPMRRDTWLADPHQEGHGWLMPARNLLRPFYSRQVSALLLELFYASSPEDRRASRDSTVRMRMLIACLCGVAHWLGGDADATL